MPKGRFNNSKCGGKEGGLEFPIANSKKKQRRKLGGSTRQVGEEEEKNPKTPKRVCS